jgi:hypothetical protein
MNPAPFDSKESGLAKCSDGMFYINEQALVDGWELYLKTKLDPETSKIGAALRAISEEKRIQRTVNGTRIRFRVIQLDNLLSWADQHNIGDREQLLRATGAKDIELDNVIPMQKRADDGVPF